jgi:hypothetical protein
VRALRPGQSRTVTLLARDDGAGAKVVVLGQGSDLEPADNERALR